MNRCPRADAAAFARHAKIKPDDGTLLAAIRDFVAWFYAPGQPQSQLDEQVQYAAELYTRRDHDGACIPKTVLFAHYKHLQYETYGPTLELSEPARHALQGKTVASWPDGEEARGDTWNQLFAEYTMGYDRHES